MLVQALEYGPMPAAQAIRRCEELRTESAGEGALEAAIASSLAQLTAMQGDLEAARRLYADAGVLYDELGLHYLRACRRLVGARIETLAGEPDAGIAELQTGYAALEEMGERGTRSTLAAFLAHALAEAGRFEEAEEFARISAETGGRTTRTSSKTTSTTSVVDWLTASTSRSSSRSTGRRIRLAATGS
jgi:ATP/maltotriose-dependent transcriptional regulator MalT